MTQEQARDVLSPIFTPDIIDAYLAQAVADHGSEYWERFNSPAALIADVRLYMRALDLQEGLDAQQAT